MVKKEDGKVIRDIKKQLAEITALKIKIYEQLIVARQADGQTIDRVTVGGPEDMVTGDSAVIDTTALTQTKIKKQLAEIMSKRLEIYKQLIAAKQVGSQTVERVAVGGPETTVNTDDSAAIDTTALTQAEVKKQLAEIMAERVEIYKQLIAARQVGGEEMSDDFINSKFANQDSNVPQTAATLNQSPTEVNGGIEGVETEDTVTDETEVESSETDVKRKEKGGFGHNIKNFFKRMTGWIIGLFR